MADEERELLLLLLLLLFLRRRRRRRWLAERSALKRKRRTWHIFHISIISLTCFQAKGLCDVQPRFILELLISKIWANFIIKERVISHKLSQSLVWTCRHFDDQWQNMLKQRRSLELVNSVTYIFVIFAYAYFSYVHTGETNESTSTRKGKCLFFLCLFLCLFQAC